MPDDVRITPVGDSALVIHCEPFAAALARRLVRAAINGVRDVVPTFQTVGVYFDPGTVAAATIADRLRLEIVSMASDDSEPEGALHHIGVSYGGSLGPDLADVAARAGLPAAEVIARHSQRIYRVMMIGFSPGFAYLGEVDAAITIPRRASPRTAVPAGSVAIAGNYTGIYPSVSPGGWHVIGHTRFVPFDLARPDPCMFKAGDRVRFLPLSEPSTQAELA